MIYALQVLAALLVCEIKCRACLKYGAVGLMLGKPTETIGNHCIAAILPIPVPSYAYHLIILEMVELKPE